MKSICDTIDKMLALVPLEQVHLRAGLTSIQSSAIYTPPECPRERWVELSQLLGLRVPRDAGRPDWAKQVIAVFEDDSEAA